MKQLLPEHEYLQKLPKKRSGVGILLFDEENRLLIVKPNYKKDGWSTPGGVIDAGESPLAAAIRETKEELGLDIPDMQFLLIEYTSNPAADDEGLEFMFYGGILSKTDTEKMKVSEEEFDDYKFVPIEEALPLLRESIRRRTMAALEALRSGIPMYTEFHK